MEINKSNINRVNNTPIAKYKKPELSQEQEAKDFSNCPNPAEYIGRSQVVFRGKPEKVRLPQKKEKDLQPIKLEKSPILEKAELLNVLKELSFTDEEISQIDLDNPKIIEGLSGLREYFEIYEVKDSKKEMIEEFQSRSSEDKLEFINDELQSANVIYVNKKNIDTLKQYIKFDFDDIFGVIENLTESDTLLEKVPIISYAQGKIDSYDLRHLSYSSSIDDISYDRAEIIRKINNILPAERALPAVQCSNLGNDEDLTPSNVKRYLTILEKYQQNPAFDIDSLKPHYENKTLKEITDSMTQIDSVLEQYPMDFESSDDTFKITKSTLEQLSQRSDIADVQKYINSLSKEAKSLGIRQIPDTDSTLDKTKLAQICNIVTEKDYGQVNTGKLFNYINQHQENIDGIIKLINRYKGTNTLNSYVDRALTVGNNDYDNAIKALNLRDEINAKDLKLNDYCFCEALHNPDCNLENFNKMLQYINDNNIPPVDNESGWYLPNYNERFFTDPKGLNKLILGYKVGKYINDEERMKLFDLAGTLNNEEEVNYVIDLMEQKKYPSEKDYWEYRFDLNIDTMKEIMQLYQEDKESTKAVLEMKTKNNDWRFSSGRNIPPLIRLYQSDNELFTDIVNLKTESNYPRFYNSDDIKSLMDSAKIDKDYTFRLINLKDECFSRKEHRFSPEDVENIVKSAQIDKKFTDYLLDQKFTNEYGQECYRIYQSEDYIYFAQKAQEDKEFVTSLFEMKTKNYDGTERARFDSQTIESILDNPPENKEFLLELINKKKTEWGRERNSYNDYDVRELAKAAKIDRDLTETLLNAKIVTTNYNKEEEIYPRFHSVSDLTYIVQQSEIDPEFTKALLDYTEKKWNDDILPRFDKDDIIYLLRLREKGVSREEITKFINETTTTYDDRTVPRYSAGEIYTILDLKKQYPEIDTLLNTKGLSSTGKEYPLYTVNDIQYIVEAISKNKDYTEKLISKNPALSRELRLGGLDILHLAEAANTDMEFTDKLCSYRRLDKNGKETYKFTIEDINSIVASNIKDKNYVFELIDMTCKKNGKENVIRFDEADEILSIIKSAQKDKEFTNKLLSMTNEKGEPAFEANTINNIVFNIIPEEFKDLETKIGNTIYSCSAGDMITAVQFKELFDIESVNEIPLAMKKDMLKNLISTNANLFNISPELKEHFPLLPTNVDEYCELLPTLVRSIGIETNELESKAINKFNTDINKLAESLRDLSDEEFNNLEIKQEYPKEEFIKDVLEIVNNAELSHREKQRVYDYYGFELHKNPNNPTGYSIVGYPVNLNNGKKLSEIKDPKTKEVVETLRKKVIKFSENNDISSNNKTIKKLMNDIVSVLPEIHTIIGKQQHDAHDFDVLKHSLKVMQKIAQNPNFNGLNESDKKVMLLASLMHDITKVEGLSDSTHSNESSFDTFFIAKKFNLSKEEEIKLYTIIKNHEWLAYVNTAEKHGETKEKRMQSVAFDLQQGNNFELSYMFTKADLQSVKKVMNKTFKEFAVAADEFYPKINDYIAELKKSQPLLPTTKMPKASTIEKAITYVAEDGSTNIKGVYKDKNGLVVVKFNEVEDWEAIGLPKGSTNRGINVTAIENINGEQIESEVETGNIKFFIHGLDYANQLAKFDAFSLANSDALLSVSYAERPETKFRFFRPQGVMLDVPADYVYGGGNTDSGSGCGKSIEQFKNGYVFGGYRESDRKYISDLIKEETGMNDEEYVKFVEQNKDKPMTAIEPKELQNKIIKKLATINSNHRKGNRAYNEMYISNPKSVMGVFAYNMNDGEAIEKPLEFLEKEDNRTDFLKKYALEHDVPFYVFGD